MPQSVDPQNWCLMHNFSALSCFSRLVLIASLPLIAAALGFSVLASQNKSDAKSPEGETEKKKPHKSNKQIAQDAAAVLKPGPEHAILATLVGDFDVTATYYSGPQDKEGQSFPLRGHRELIDGGRLLKERLRSLSAKPRIDRTVYWGYDRSLEKYTLLEFGGGSTSTQLFRGERSDDGSLVLQSANVRGGDRISTQDTWTMSFGEEAADQQTLTLTTQLRNISEYRVMSFRYTRRPLANPTMQDLMTMRNVSEEHKRLHVLLGTWPGVMEAHPRGLPSLSYEGGAQVRKVVGDLYIEEIFVAKGPMGEATFRMTYGWDPAAEVYQVSILSSEYSQIQLSEGHFVEDKNAIIFKGQYFDLAVSRTVPIELVLGLPNDRGERSTTVRTKPGAEWLESAKYNYKRGG